MPLPEETEEWLKSFRGRSQEPASAFEGGLHLQQWLLNPEDSETGCSLIDNPLLFDPNTYD